jgi:hypothetical protein
VFTVNKTCFAIRYRVYPNSKNTKILYCLLKYRLLQLKENNSIVEFPLLLLLSEQVKHTLLKFRRSVKSIQDIRNQDWAILISLIPERFREIYNGEPTGTIVLTTFISRIIIDNVICQAQIDAVMIAIYSGSGFNQYFIFPCCLWPFAIAGMFYSFARRYPYIL